MITGALSNNAEDDYYIEDKAGNSKEVEMVLYWQEFEDLLYGFNHCLDYVNAVSELQDCRDNFFFEARTLSTNLIHLLHRNIKSEENLTVRLDIPSLENLSAASDLILYMTITQLSSQGCDHQYHEKGIKRCYATFAALKERIERLI